MCIVYTHTHSHTTPYARSYLRRYTHGHLWKRGTGLKRAIVRRDSSGLMASLFGSIPHLLINRIAAQTAYRHGHGRLPCRPTFSASPRKIIPVKPSPYRGLALSLSLSLSLSSVRLPLRSRTLPFRSPARWKRRACGCWLASFRNRGDGYYHRLIPELVAFVHSLSHLLRSFCPLPRRFSAE